MAFKAKFKVGGKEFNVLDCSYELNQQTDATGRPSSVTRGGLFRVVIESTEDTTNFEWMTNNFERKDGVIEYIKRDTNSKLKELRFKEGYLVGFKENFESTGKNPFTTELRVSAREIGIGNGEHVNEWV